jgi:hypothetical protein
MTQLALAQEAVDMSRATLAKFLVKTNDFYHSLRSGECRRWTAALYHRHSRRSIG